MKKFEEAKIQIAKFKIEDVITQVACLKLVKTRLPVRAVSGTNIDDIAQIAKRN